MSSPLVFVLSPGVDPSAEVFKLANMMGYGTHDRLISISLGQGQGPLAENAIREVSLLVFFFFSFVERSDEGFICGFCLRFVYDLCTTSFY